MSNERKISDTDLKKVSGGADIKIDHLQDNPNRPGVRPSINPQPIDAGGSGPGPEGVGGGGNSGIA